MLEQDSSKIIVTENSISKNDTLRILFIGDSFTLPGVYEKYFKDIYISSTASPIKLVGSNSNTLYPYWGVDNEIYHEGYSGRSWEWFANYLESPFVFDAVGALDFDRYFSETLHGEKPDLVVLFMGICNMGLTDPYPIEVIDNLISSFFTTTKMLKLINSLTIKLPDAKLGVVLIPPPNEREYTHTDPDYWERKIMYHRLDQRYEDFFKNYNQNISVIPVSSNIDTFSSFGETDGVHPNPAGYMQIAHSIYGWVKYQISQMMTEPKNITISYSSSSANLSWGASSGAFLYNIYRSTEPYYGFVKIGTTTFTEFTDSGIDNSEKYFYKVTADNSLK